MHLAEPAMQQQTGITPSMLEYITRAFAESKLSIFQRYLEPHEYAFVRAHYFDRMQEWPALVAQLNDAMTRGVPPDAAEARALGAHWLALFRSYASDDPAMQAKFVRRCSRSRSSWRAPLTPTLLGYLQAAVTASLTAG